jgi:hypothetical protein
MALWRDHLDELIEELEKVLPPAPSPTQGLLGMSLEDLQMTIAKILYGQRNDPLIIEAEAIADDDDSDTSGNTAAKEEDDDDDTSE